MIVTLDWVVGKGSFQEVTERTKLHGASHEQSKGHIALGRGNSLVPRSRVRNKLGVLEGQKEGQYNGQSGG